MSRAQWTSRACALCGSPSDRKRLCSRCDPTRPTRTHRDKYGTRNTVSGAQPASATHDRRPPHGLPHGPDLYRTRNHHRKEPAMTATADLLARLSPATRGLRDVWRGSHRGYLGGPLDGQPVAPGYQGLRRDETGRPLRTSKATPAHYVLHTGDADHTRAYVHTSLIEPGQ